MTRFRGDLSPVTRATDAGWEAVAAGFGRVARDATDRGDIIVRIGADTADGRAKACFIPSFAQIELHPGLFPDGLDPADIDPTRFTCRHRMPVAQGALTHECGHVCYTLWDPPPEARGTAAAEAAILLEEVRMEAAVVDYRPGDRRWLRSCAREVILSEIPPCKDIATAARIALLVLGRVDAGVLDASEVRSVREAVLDTLGEETLETLEAIWQEALEVEDDDATAMMDLGRRWCEAIAVDPESEDGSEADENEGTAGASADPGPLAAAVAAALDDVIEATTKEIDGPRIAAEEAAAKAAADEAERAAAAKARAAAEKKAAVVFGPHSHRGGKTAVTLRSRAPLPAERAAANRITAAMRRAHHIERTRIVSHSQVPPGRLRMRGAMAASVQRAQGRTVTAEPWTQVQRRQVHNPPPSVGLAVDISGSMGVAEEPISSATWVVGEAVRRLGGKFAAVAYGSVVAPIVRPGQRPTSVTEFTANHGTEEFCDAVEALDGALGLSWAEGARLLVIVSDGHYTPSQQANGQRLVNRLRASGCAVLWLYVEDGFPPVLMSNVVARSFPDDMATAGAIIGEAAVAAVEAARSRIAA